MAARLCWYPDRDMHSSQQRSKVNWSKIWLKGVDSPSTYRFNRRTWRWEEILIGWISLTITQLVYHLTLFIHRPPQLACRDSGPRRLYSSQRPSFLVALQSPWMRCWMVGWYGTWSLCREYLPHCTSCPCGTEHAPWSWQTYKVKICTSSACCVIRKYCVGNDYILTDREKSLEFPALL